MDDATLLRRALELAAIHSADGVHGPFGAVVAREGRVVGEGWNQVVATADPTAHAEVMALRDAARRLGTHDLAGCVLYASCEPCPMCLAATYWARVERLVYAASAADAAAAGFDDAHIQGELALGWGERALASDRLLADEGRAVLEGWLANSRRVPY